MIDQMPWLSLLAPALTIVLAVLTRRVKLSLGVGIAAAALLVADLDPVGTLSRVWGAFTAQFWQDGSVSFGNLLILVFLAQLGVITSLVLMSGGSAAFSDWAAARITSRRGAQGFALLLALALFIDDYFSALAVGQVSRPITDRHHVSRAKLAYILDSTAAPMTVLVPFSSWGASIIGMLSPVVAASTLGLSDFTTFLSAAVANYYAIACMVLMVLTVVLQLDIGSMRIEERRAIETAAPFEEGTDIPGELSADLPVHDDGAKRALIVPFVALTAAVVACMYTSGWAVGGDANPIEALGNTMLPESLAVGGVVGLGFALYYYLRYTGDNSEFNGSALGRGVLEGLKSMWPAIAILVLAWMLGELIAQAGTGDYLAHLVQASQLPHAWLVPVMFILAGLIAFSTGTSWGSFGLLIPIVGESMLSLGADDLLIPALGAVLAGAVLGDHISPISDTTILSSTGSRANIITHVKTQLPYALTAAFCALIGYGITAATQNVLLGLAATLLVLGVLVLIAHRRNPVLLEVIPEYEQAERADVD